MGGCCQKQRTPTGAGTPIGTLVAKGSGCFGCSPPYTFGEPGCCDPGATMPTGAAYEAAKPGLEELILEVNDICAVEKNCCGAPDLEKCKRKLDAEWTPRVVKYLEQHGLTADLEQFWIYNGQSASEHLNLRLYTIEEYSKNLLEGACEKSA